MVNKKSTKTSKSNYVILAIILLILAGGLVLLPKYQKHEGLNPTELLASAISLERYITTDQLADRIINKDPSLLLIDVRDPESFKSYSLPNAFNIPLPKLLDEESEGYINQDAYDIILFSNDNVYSDQAWILCKRLKYKNLHVLKGGINNWYNTIINPPKPIENMPTLDFELYSTRKAASMYFGVAYPEQAKRKSIEVKNSGPKQVVPVRKKKKMQAEGGC